MSRWILLHKTSPSGKSLFVCRMCGRITPAPSKTCDPDSGVGNNVIGVSCQLLEEIADSVEEFHDGKAAQATVTTIEANGVAAVRLTWVDSKNVSRLAGVYVTKEGQQAYIDLLARGNVIKQLA